MGLIERLWHRLSKGHWPCFVVIGYDKYNFDELSDCRICEVQ